MLGLDNRTLSPAAAQVVSIAGVQTSFAQASEVTLQKLCGLKVSESTVERVTEDAGERLKELLEEGETFGEDEPLEWQRDAKGRTCAYVSLDATGIRRQGPNGAQAEGRMAYVGMIYNAHSKYDERVPTPHSVRYLAGFYELSELGRQLRRQAAQVGWDGAEQQIALSDGGGGLEEFLRVHFPRAERILDFWHASEHLVEQLGLLGRFRQTLKTEEVYWRLYDSPQHARECLAKSRERYNEVRPHWTLDASARGGRRSVRSGGGVRRAEGEKVPGA